MIEYRIFLPSMIRDLGSPPIPSVWKVPIVTPKEPTAFKPVSGKPEPLKPKEPTECIIDISDNDNDDKENETLQSRKTRFGVISLEREKPCLEKDHLTLLGKNKRVGTKRKDKKKGHKSAIIKNPCILIFDSMTSSNGHSNVITCLRNYLSWEHKRKLGIEKEFSEATIKAHEPKVPQQTNSSDCGIYLLQYVESFFQTPIRNFTIPITTLEEWFDSKEVTNNKRKELIKLVSIMWNETQPLPQPRHCEFIRESSVESNIIVVDEEEEKFTEKEINSICDPEELKIHKSCTRKILDNVKTLRKIPQRSCKKKLLLNNLKKLKARILQDSSRGLGDQKPSEDILEKPVVNILQNRHRLRRLSANTLEKSKVKTLRKSTRISCDKRFSEINSVKKILRRSSQIGIINDRCLVRDFCLKSFGVRDFGIIKLCNKELQSIRRKVSNIVYI